VEVLKHTLFNILRGLTLAQLDDNLRGLLTKVPGDDGVCLISPALIQFAGMTNPRQGKSVGSLKSGVETLHQRFKRIINWFIDVLFSIWADDHAQSTFASQRRVAAVCEVRVGLDLPFSAFAGTDEKSFTTSCVKC
jgi:hypothetical protein